MAWMLELANVEGRVQDYMMNKDRRPELSDMQKLQIYNDAVERRQEAESGQGRG